MLNKKIKFYVVLLLVFALLYPVNLVAVNAANDSVDFVVNGSGTLDMDGGMHYIENYGNEPRYTITSYTYPQRISSNKISVLSSNLDWTKTAKYKIHLKYTDQNNTYFIDREVTKSDIGKTFDVTPDNTYIKIDFNLPFALDDITWIVPYSGIISKEANYSLGSSNNTNIYLHKGKYHFYFGGFTDGILYSVFKENVDISSTSNTVNISPNEIAKVQLVYNQTESQLNVRNVIARNNDVNHHYLVNLKENTSSLYLSKQYTHTVDISVANEDNSVDCNLRTPILTYTDGMTINYDTKLTAKLDLGNKSYKKGSTLYMYPALGIFDSYGNRFTFNNTGKLNYKVELILKNNKNSFTIPVNLFSSGITLPAVPGVYDAEFRVMDSPVPVGSGFGKLVIDDNGGVDVTKTVNVVQKGSYIYDTTDPASGIDLPYSSINGISDPASAESVINSAAAVLTTEQKQSPAGIDAITLFSEAAIAQSATTSVTSGDVNITDSMVQALEPKAIESKTNAEAALESNNIAANREINADIKIKTDATDKLTIKVDSTIADTKADNIRVESPSFAVKLSAKAIKENAGDTPLIISIVENGSTASINQPKLYASLGNDPAMDFGLSGLTGPLAATSGKTYTITFNKTGLKENVTVSLPKAEGDVTYQAVLKADGTAIGGKYNPTTGMVEVKLKESGTYMVKQNQKDFTDIKSKSREMQDAIKLLASKGIIGGTTATKFSPDSTISRAEISALIVRTLSKLDPNANGGFKDVKKSDWYFGVAGSSKKFGIINGFNDNTYRGKQSIAKDQIVAVAARTLVSEMRYKTPSDVEKYLKGYSDRSTIASWAAPDIALATKANLVLRRTDGKFTPKEEMTRGDAAIILKRLFEKIW